MKIKFSKYRLTIFLGIVLFITSCGDNKISSSYIEHSEIDITKQRRDEIERKEKEEIREKKFQKDISELEDQLRDDKLSQEEQKKLESKIKKLKKVNYLLEKAANCWSLIAIYRENAATTYKNHEEARRVCENNITEEEKKALWYEEEAKKILSES